MSRFRNEFRRFYGGAFFALWEERVIVLLPQSAAPVSWRRVFRALGGAGDYFAPAMYRACRSEAHFACFWRSRELFCSRKAPRPSHSGVFLFGTGYRPSTARIRGGIFRRGSLPRPIERPPAQIFAQAGVFTIKSQFKRMVASHIILHAARLCRIPPQKSHTRSRFLSSAHVRFCLRGVFSPAVECLLTRTPVSVSSAFRTNSFSFAPAQVICSLTFLRAQ